MRDFERPSILAVGMPDIFDVQDVEGGTSAAEFNTSRFSELSGTPRESSTSRLSSEIGLLRWMIYSSQQSSQTNTGNELARNEFDRDSRMSVLRGSEEAQPAEARSCDDSAFGLTISGETASLDGSITAGDGQVTRADDEVSFIHASTAKRAIELLRIMRFDLLVTSDRLADMSVSQLMGRIRAVRPWQKWALVTSNDSPQSEITARSMGAAAVFDAPADLRLISELAHAVTARQPVKMAVGSSVAAESHAMQAESSQSPRRSKTTKAGNRPSHKSIRANRLAE